MRHRPGRTNPQHDAENAATFSDPKVRFYLKVLSTERGNNGLLSEKTINTTRCAASNFLRYASLPLTNHTYTDLIAYKRANRDSTDIEEALTHYSLEEPRKSQANQASRILGIFRKNFTPLEARVNTHFPPATENITKGIFRDIYTHLTTEQQDMIQWNLYVPERSKAAYCIPFEDIDTTRSAYAIAHIAGETPNANGIRSKMRVSHPAIIPIEFARRTIEASRKAGRNCPFPNHTTLWREITAFAKTEYQVRLVSNYTRKYFQDAAEESNLRPSIAAFILGDKTKLNQATHLGLVYSPTLRPAEIERLIEAYHQSKITEALTLPRT